MHRAVRPTGIALLVQRMQGPGNGVLHNAARTQHIGTYLDEGLKIPAAKFVQTKAKRGFINDPIKPLYLATHLWTRTWRTEFGGGTADITIDERATAARLQREYGIGGVTVIRDALALLERAGLAAKEGNGSWTVSRKSLGRSGNSEVAKAIARRATAKRTPALVKRSPRRPAVEMDTLF